VEESTGTFAGKVASKTPGETDSAESTESTDDLESESETKKEESSE
jgi:hypothetical protein